MILIVMLLGFISVAWAAAVPAVVSPYAYQSHIDGCLSPTIGNGATNGSAYIYGAQGKTSQSHSVKKRSLGYNTDAFPALVATPAVASHQFRLDVISKHAVGSHAVAKPVLAHVTPVARIVPAAVTQQARVDVISSPAIIVSHAIAKPLLAHAAPVVTAPSAVSHQSRVDVYTSPTLIGHTVAPINYAASHHSDYNGSTGYNDYIDYYNSAPLVQSW